MSHDSVIRSSPDDVRDLLSSAQGYYSRKEFAAAKSICRNILHQEPTHKTALYLLALCALYTGRHEEAVTVLSDLVRNHPDHVNGLVLLSKIHLRFDNYRQSALSARKALELNVTDDRLLALLADLLGRSEDHESAKVAYERAVQINPGNAGHWCNYASILRIEGRIDEATNALEKAIMLDENHCKAHWILSSLRRQTKSVNHVERLEQVKARNSINSLGAMLIDFALSKEYEDIGEYEKSFDCLSHACSLKRKSIDYDVERDTRPLQQLEGLFDSDYVRQMSGSGLADNAPIFIVGLPRTGSTLIEQILTASGQLLAAGELPFFGNEMVRLFHKEADQVVDFSSLRDKDIDFRELGKSYVENSIDFIKSAAHRAAVELPVTFVDKMPQNFLYLGFIMLALPNAKVIATSRDPVDTCLSNFKQLYNDPFYQFSYRLDEMASYFIAYNRLMQHWSRLFGKRVFTVRYEDFVKMPEVNAARMFEYCGIAWHRKYLEGARRNRFVATASATQVREAISVGSVNRWKKYRQQLSPVLRQLAQAGLDVV